MNTVDQQKKQEIPVFFSTDDNYIPYLDIAIASLIANASRAYTYRLIILNTGLLQENIDKILQNQREGFTIDFVNITNEVENIKNRFKNVYHFSVVTYYRLFIASLFPHYDKIVYLDCDLVVLGDIAELYHTDLNGCIIGAAPEQFVQNTAEFRLYAETALGVCPSEYVNAGVMVIDLKQFRAHRIEEQFVDLITRYDFDLLDPDQAYLNYLCQGRIHRLPNGWNKEPMPLPCEGKKNIVHYALYKKPWQYDDVLDGNYFWQYAEASPFYHEILNRKKQFGDEEKAKKEAVAREILAHALRIVASDYTFVKKLRTK
ncbi:MAG: glycosyltransferase family 8 protein [Ruminococcaceae bacterium]|nr:glycosyltransferase family 8 protein [Oscillospiraceae bacterium]